MKRRCLFGLIALATACGSGDAAPVPVDPPAAEATAAVWSARSASGVGVHVQPATPVLHSGDVVFRIATDGAGPQREVQSVDLVSSSMPLHGVMRFPVEEAGDATYLAHLAIPMEGRWMLYVNLDEGADAAEFHFEVAPAPAGGHHHLAADAADGPAPDGIADAHAAHHSSRAAPDGHSHPHAH